MGKLWTLQGHIKDYRMKYIVGASIGGLFGLSMPFVLDAQQIEDEIISTQEESQPVEDMSPIPIESSITLPDNFCGYIEYESTDVKEQAKECLRRSILAVPAI